MKIAIVVATTVGVVVGVLGTALLADVSQEVVPGAVVSVDSAKVNDDAALDELIQLRASHETLEAELAATKLALDMALTDVGSATQQASVVTEEASIMEQLGEEIEDAALRDMTERRAESEQRREEWQQRREEWSTEFRDRTNTFFDDAVANATSGAEQERLLAMQDHMGALQDLREEMGAAETDEEREVIRDAMRENGEAMEVMVKKQQQHILSQVAQDYGVTKPKEKRQLADAMQEAMESPFFWGGRMFGGGYGGGRGGSGGPGGRGR